MNQLKISVFCFLAAISSLTAQGQPINRKAVVLRHNIVNTRMDSLESLSLGNGKFAFTADITGLQTFPEAYDKGVCLGTQSEWGWDSFKDTVGYRFEETLKEYNLNGRKSTYCVQWPAPLRKRNASEWFRKNPHRLQLGNLGFDIRRPDGSPISASDIKDVRQELNLWNGELRSHFTVNSIPVDVVTVVHQEMDVVAVRIQSRLITEGKLKIRLRFPYPTAAFADAGDNWNDAQKHQSSILSSGRGGAIVEHQLDNITYFTTFQWTEGVLSATGIPHCYIIKPDSRKDVFEFSCLFSSSKEEPSLVPDFQTSLLNNRNLWNKFWMSGAAVDFGESTDPRAKELERRIVLSEYLTKIQCAGSFPPQETGLTYNSWFGKPHLEMHWWHAVHFALWNRVDLMEKSLDYYFKVAGKARQIAQRQGFDGVRWQKMTDHDGNESPSSVGAFLIWQQPHFIYMAELAYRDKKDKEVLQKYKDLVFATADFMASFPVYEKEKDRYNLGKGLIPAQEVFKAEETFNPTYEVAYWDWALRIAQKWRERLGMQRNEQWDKVIVKLTPLPQSNGVYLATENAPDSYTNERWRTDHPSVLGAFGMLPASQKLNKATMQRTFDTVWKTWFWNDTWGWDFPMTAMTAARLGNPSKAIDALFMKVPTNRYLKNGHNYQDGRLRIYLPGNGGLLTAIAMMAGGWDGSVGLNPGFPKNGKWKVRAEGFKRMP